MIRITQQQLESYLWGAAVLLRGTIDAGDYKQFIFPMLFYKRICDVYDEETQSALNESGGDVDYARFPENHRFQVPADAHWNEMRKVNRDVGRALQHSMRAIETANPDKLYGIFGDAQWTNKERLSDAMLRDLIEHFCTLELTVANLPEDELGQGYEYLIKKFADDSGHTAAEFYTNRTVVHLMTEMLDVQPGESVYDPTCGSGGMLLSCITHLRNQKREWRNVKLYGQERNLMTSSIARMNCFLHGIEDFRIERGDTLAEPKLVEGDRLMRFDVVLANPPYSIKQWDREAFASDPWGRNLYGTPPQGRADYAFQQHILQSLKPKTGRCAVLWPHGVLFRQEEAEMRRKLIEADLVECVLGLGPNLFYNSPMEACVVICRMQKPKNRRGKILFINAVNEVTRERAQSFLTDDHLQRIIRAYQDFKDEPGFTRVVTVDDIRAKDWTLSIPLYVVNAEHRRTQIRSSGGDLQEPFEKWVASSSATRGALLKVTAVEEQKVTDLSVLKMVMPAWLDRSKWSRPQFGDIAECAREMGQPGPEDAPSYVGLEHLDSGSLHVRRWGSDADLKGQKLKMRRGDILFAKRNAYLRRVAIAPHDGYFSAHGMILRARPDKVLPEFLPFLMMSDRFMNRAVEISVGSLSPTINWTTLKLEELDLPPLEQQRRIAEILWAVDEMMSSQDALEKDTKNARKTFFDTTVTDGRNSAARGEIETWPHWREVTLSEAVEFLDGQRKPIKEADRAKRRGDYPYYGASGVIDTIDDFIFDEHLVLLGEDGANIVDRSSPLAFRVSGKIWVNNHAHVLRVRQPNSLVYVEYYLESLDYKPFVTGTAQPKLNKGVCEGIRIPLPDGKFQTQVELRLLAFEKALESQAANAKQTRELLSSLLNQFT